MGAVDDGTVLPGRYVADPVLPPGTLRNQVGIVEHAVRLAARIEEVQVRGRAPLIIGGDCSLLVGTGLAMSRRGRYGLVHVDGHTDFRHPGNSDECASLAGEDLAAAVGLHWPAVSNIERRSPYVAAKDVVHVGCRSDDEHLREVRETIARTIPASELQEVGAESAAQQIREVVTRHGISGYWLHVDLDVLDPSHLPAVDSPSPGGLSPAELTALLSALAPDAAGAQVTVFDPDLDPDGSYASLVADVVVEGLGVLGSAKS
jgi:arginase